MSEIMSSATKKSRYYHKPEGRIRMRMEQDSSYRNFERFDSSPE